MKIESIIYDKFLWKRISFHVETFYISEQLDR